MKKKLIYFILILFIFTELSCVKASVVEDDLSLPSNLPKIDADIVFDGTAINLSWKPVDKAQMYYIYHSGSRLGEASLIKTVKETFFSVKPKNKNKYENYYKIIAADNEKKLLAETMVSLELKIFGANVKFYDKKYDKDPDIERDVNRIHNMEMFGNVRQPDGRNGEFSSKRYALFFKPGEYQFNEYRAGFYTHFAGLGKTPADTTLKGTVTTPPHLPSNNATCTFWRSIENFQISDNGEGNVFRWGVSQSSSVRRMLVNVSTYYHYHNGWASGGFTADSHFTGIVDGGSQQQWYTRNSHHTTALKGVGWNKVVQGTTGQVENTNAKGSVTKIETTPVIREKPFLYIDNGEYKVFVPALRYDAQGTSWKEDYIGDGYSLDLLSNFYIAKAGIDTAASINAQLDAGKHIYITPGKYELEVPIRVRNAGTIILGHGFPTLYPAPSNKYGALFVDDVEDVTIAGLMFDASPGGSTYLLALGEMDADANHSGKPTQHAATPLAATLLADLCLRVGGFYSVPVNADISVLINSSNVIGDHLWVWRADHGYRTVIGWDINTTRNGVVVRGDDVTMYGLFVEHFHEYSTLWTGDRGRVFFYQNEAPYDPHWQSGYKSHYGTVDGWAQYKVANTVNEHLAVGLGVYCVFMRDNSWSGNTNEPIYIENAIEVPHKPNVRIQNATIVYLGTQNNGGIRSIVNGTGQPAVNGWGQGNVYLREFVNGTAVLNHDGTRARAPASGKEPEDEEHLSWLTFPLIP